jgi:N-succinyldiaminopimelate aminotransferase
MRTSQRLRPFGTTIFSEMTRLAEAHGAINLSQGFPDFEGPPELVESVLEAYREGHNQYARSRGHPRLVEALAAEAEAHLGLRYEPSTEVVVTSGATEAIASAMLGLLDPGDEVVLFEPFYDSYPAAVRMAGGVTRFVTLRPPGLRLDPAELEAALSPRTRLILLNTPHNPTGKVFDDAELEAIARVARARDLVVVSDEVYEHLSYDGVRHRSIAALDGMRERTLRLSSAGKTFSFTGWKVGWGMGPPALVDALQAAHQFVTFSTSTAVQVGLGRGLGRLDPGYYEQLRADYQTRRDFLCEALEAAGFDVLRPRGAYFVLAGFERLFDGDDQAFARHLIERHGVAAIPPSVFFEAEPEAGRRVLRFAFCKRLDTLEAAAERLAGLRG